MKGIKYMWEKIKNWWADRKAKRAEKRLKRQLNFEIAVNQFFGGPNWVSYDMHKIPTLICSVYFNSDKDWTIVDFSRESEGIAHFILYTPKSITDYKGGVDQDPTIEVKRTILHDVWVYKKYYKDGSEGWCFS